MKVLLIADTHTFHKELIIPEGIDMIIHAGDVSNPKNPIANEPEVLDFISWYESLDVKYKLWCAGNHDTSIEKGLVKPLELVRTTRYLEHEEITIEGIKIFMSPFTPEFCGWAFNVRRDRMPEYWKGIPEDVDILVTHGPPKGIMDLADNSHGFEQCGDKSLYDRVIQIKPKFHHFGHIHENGWCLNKGIKQFPDNPTVFINASCVTDGKFNLGLTSQGIVITI